jgi:two-component system NtrC family sensor kinase
MKSETKLRGHSMKTGDQKRRPIGITLRTALLSWLVTLVTLSIFVIVIIPQQKRTFLENLHSKAQGAAASLQGIAAGAAVNEDYSSVVEQCLAMMDGDKSVNFLVITKKGGVSQVCQQENPRWIQEDSDVNWRPAKSKPASGIENIPLLDRRVFHYSQPFDYSGIQWGWIHVGLSLESYDKNVKSVYLRTGILAVVCTLFSLLASAVYAKRLVKPLLNVRSVVQKVASGDLSARATVSGQDELGSLAISVNAMTEALLHRDHILQSIRFAAQEFLSTTEWQEIVHEVLANIGLATGVDRIHIYENKVGEAGLLHAELCHEWTKPGAPKTLAPDDSSQETFSSRDFADWLVLLQRKQTIAAHYRELTAAQQQAVGRSDFKSLLVIPIVVEECWWGILTLAACHSERVWSDAEKDSLQAVAKMLGAAIARQRTQDKLIEAKNTLEQRVRARTVELQEQVGAKEKARAELAEAQQRLFEASRKAGQAEVATGVLHNVGNVLNSVNVSANLLYDRWRHSKIAGFTKAAALLSQHANDLAPYLTQDPKGQLLPAYLIQLAEHLAGEQAGHLKELKELAKNVEHIKEIVAMQQSYAKVSGVLESLPIALVVNDALQMNVAAFSRHGVEVVRHYEEVPPVIVDKHRVLQILINLFRNAKYALDEKPGPGAKRLNVSIGLNGNERVKIVVRDNGIGIQPENLTRIFSHGFTTKKQGHGFGLHMGALAAKEMGGSLTAHSEGPGLGATFTLELPVGKRLLERAIV